jgi:YD repeat-containing protein
VQTHSFWASRWVDMRTVPMAASAKALVVMVGALALGGGCGHSSDRQEERDSVGFRSDPLPKPVGNNGDLDYCTSSNKCLGGEGDCDGNSNCASGTACLTNNGRKFGMPLRHDVCAPSHCANGALDTANGETAVDCGGPCGSCLPAHCTNGALDSGSGEAAVDCGGPCGSCPPACIGTAGGADYCLDCLCAGGQGDCDSNNECGSGLVCASDNGPRFGAAGGIDACVAPHCLNDQLDAAAGETDIDCGGPCGDCLEECEGTPGAAAFCVTCRCTTAQGDCDGSRECASGLICASNHGPRMGFGAGTDVCMPSQCNNDTQDAGETAVDCGGPCPECLAPCLGTPGSDVYCTTCRCTDAQGDCDFDRECALGLECVSNVGTSYGYGSSTDVCVPLPGTRNTEFNYDALGRLTTVTVNGTTREGYGYDRVGNRCTVSDGPVVETNGYCPGSAFHEHYSSTWTDDGSPVAVYSDADGIFTLTWTLLPYTTRLELYHTPPGQAVVITELSIDAVKQTYSALASGLHVFYLYACVTEFDASNNEFTNCQNITRFDVTVN